MTGRASGRKFRSREGSRLPTYDYECENGHRFEVFQSMKDDPLEKCTQCDAKARRVIGPGAGFIFKGGGFYITEYRSKEYKDKAKAESGSSGGGAGSGGEKPSGKAAESSGAKSAEKTSGGKTEGRSSGKGGEGSGKQSGDKGSGGTSGGS
jgi:putative FmdB family regulatory protein